MELTNDDSFDPTPKLKSSPVPISFISFNDDDKNCIHCGDIYTETSIGRQKYCKKCLLCYLTNITDKNIYLDVYIYTRNLECNEHEISTTKEPQNIQECCRNCLEVLCFKQIPDNDFFDKIMNDYLFKNVIISEKYCKLCGKLFHKTYDHFALCSDCYLISSGYTESALIKKPIPIIYLPWWYNLSICEACYSKLKFTSDFQKYCENCLTLYTGCRYCLTTNVIFGVTNQSQCKKCKRVSLIIFDIEKFRSGNSDLDDFLVNLRTEIHNRLEITKFTDKIKNIDKYFYPNTLFGSIYNTFEYDGAEILMEWIPYSQFTNVKEIAKGGFGISKYFLNELKSNQHCYALDRHIIKTHGFTKDPKFDDYILVMQYASGGDLHKYLREQFTNITWDKRKISILWQIAKGLETIHNAKFIHQRPEITKDTPECYANIMKSCWDPDPEKRPSITEIRKILSKWYCRNKDLEQFNQAEIKRKELINLKELGPEFNGKTHPSAIYTSRPLRSFISRCSSYFSKDYNSIELELDIDIKSSNILEKKRNIEELEINSYGNSGKHIKIETT
ncbi:unnamed protein product [Rhizophagus irregularis]|nr:unnamed protein product [Rhizophagus irregularis]